MLGTWATTQWTVFFIPFGLLAVALLVLFLLRDTIRSRVRMARQLERDPDIDEFLIVFDWSRKVLYVPTILASLAAGIVMLFVSNPASTVSLVVGGCWLAVFFLNFLIDEYEISVKVLLIALLFLFLVGLWLVMLGWLTGFLSAFRRLHVSISAAGYFVIAGIFVLAIAISWLRGLFFYAALTPNYLNLQAGPTETGEQIHHADFYTRIDTGDFLERLLGFGRILITFRDNRKSPVILLVWRIGQRAATLESIRGKIAVETHRTSHPAVQAPLETSV